MEIVPVRVISPSGHHLLDKVNISIKNTFHRHTTPCKQFFSTLTSYEHRGCHCDGTVKCYLIYKVYKQPALVSETQGAGVVSQWLPWSLVTLRTRVRLTISGLCLNLVTRRVMAGILLKAAENNTHSRRLFLIIWVIVVYLCLNG